MLMFCPMFSYVRCRIVTLNLLIGDKEKQTAELFFRFFQTCCHFVRSTEGAGVILVPQNKEHMLRTHFIEKF